MVLHVNPFIGGMKDNFERIAMTFYIEDIVESYKQNKQLKQVNDVYIMIQGQRLHQYPQLGDIPKINPLNVYAYNNKGNAGYTTQIALKHVDAKQKEQRNQQFRETMNQIMKKDKKNNIRYRARKCKWTVPDFDKLNEDQVLEQFNEIQNEVKPQFMSI